MISDLCFNLEGMGFVHLLCAVFKHAKIPVESVAFISSPDEEENVRCRDYIGELDVMFALINTGRAAEWLASEGLGDLFSSDAERLGFSQ